jgi:cell division protein FtsB
VRAFLFAGIAIAAGLVLAVSNAESGLPMWWQLRSELRSSSQRTDELSQRNDHLREEIAALHSDPFALEMAIREDLEFARRGEIIIRFDRSPARVAGSH